VNPLRSSNGHPSTASCVAKVWIPRSCRHDLDLHAAPHFACTASASWPTAAVFTHSPLLCAHVSISKSKNRQTLAQPCRNLCMGLHFSRWLHWSSTRLYHHPLRRQPAIALRSPSRVRPVIPGTASDWLYMMCMIPVWYTCSSKPRTTTSTQASFARLHERRRALPPLRSVPNSSCRTWHDPARRRTDPLAMRSICADETERPWFFENVDHAWRDWPRARPADSCETLSRYTSTCAA
jgi:hypothetical protein